MVNWTKVDSYERAIRALSDGVERINASSCRYKENEKSLATFAADLGRNRTCKHLK